MIHLHSQVSIEGRLPDALGVQVRRNPERPEHLAGVSDRVDPGFADRGEIERRVSITQPFSARLDSPLKDGLVLSRRTQAQDLGRRRLVIEWIQLQHRHFRAVRGIADLVVRHHDRADPTRDDIRLDVPHQGVLRAVGGDQAAHDEPAVLRLVAGVEKREPGAVGGNGHSRHRVFRREHDPVTAGQGRGLDCASGIAHHGSVRVTRKDPGFLVQHVTLAEIRGRQKVEIESGLADQVRRQRVIQVHRHPHPLALGRQFQAITQRQLGIPGGCNQLV